MKNLIRNWNIIRLFRLLLGIAIIAQSVRSGQWSLMAVGVLFAIMPIFNIGCCATGNCGLPKRRNKQKGSKEVIFEEVK